jgi:ribosome recycling factor
MQKIGICNARKDATIPTKNKKKTGTSEDICKSAGRRSSKLTNTYIKKIDELLVKEAEIKEGVNLR